MKPTKKKSKNPSYFSHEFIIANHGDIFSVVAMLFIGGMLFKKTTPLASLFVAMQHNETVEKPIGPPDLLYTTGRYDLCAIFFYSTICIILHAVLQEYIIDKVIRKLHLPRLHQSKISESAQLFIFYVCSIYWDVYCLINENFLTSLDSVWTDYPHIHLPFWIKVFFIFQISYWIHNYPELYFQKLKKSEMPKRIYYSSLYLFGLLAAYFMNFSKLGLILLIIHYATDSIYHFARVMKYYGKPLPERIGFKIYTGVFIPSRIISTVLAFLTFYYGLPQSGVPLMNISAGNYNTWLIRLNCMLFITVLQAYMVWTFINYHFKKMREEKKQLLLNSKFSNIDSQKRKEKKKGKHDDSKESPETNNTNRETRHRKQQ